MGFVFWLDMNIHEENQHKHVIVRNSHVIYLEKCMSFLFGLCVLHIKSCDQGMAHGF